MATRDLTIAWRFVLALCLAASLSACGYRASEYQWNQRYLEAERLADHEHFEQARKMYDALIADARDPRDVRLIQYRLAYLTEHEGRLQEALKQYMTLWREGERDEVSAKSVWRAALILDQGFGQEAEAMRLWEELLLAMPAYVGADNARDELFDKWAARGDVFFLAQLDRIYPALHESEQADNLLYERARVMRRNARLDEAVAAYELLLTRYPGSGLSDDARWLCAEIRREQGRVDEALNHLRFLIETRDVAWIVGTYDSVWTSRARYQRGVIMLLEQGRYDAAVGEFEGFLREFPESIWRDDARWNIVQARLRQGSASKARQACVKLKEIEPESRWVDDCDALMEALRGGQSAKELTGKVVAPWDP